MKRNFFVNAIGGFVGFVLALLFVSITNSANALSINQPVTVQAPASSVSAPSATAISTMFTYQGQLKNSGSPVTGSCSLAFRLYDDPLAGILVGSPITLTTVPITNGLFTVGLNFGGNAFTGDARWLAISVNCGSGFTALSPRQAITAAPYALHATDAWSLNGNDGTNANANFLGTTDNLTLTLRVSNTVAFRIVPAINNRTPNVIGGYSGNFISPTVEGGVIGGGGASNFVNSVRGDYGTVGGGFENTASSIFATVGGGDNNIAGGNSATVSGGFGNNASGQLATIGGGGFNGSGQEATVSGGFGNIASGQLATIGGGDANFASGADATVSGGAGNVASGLASTIPGGFDNAAGGEYSFATGRRAKLASSADGSFMFADSNNFDFNSSAANVFRVRTTGGVRFVVGINGSGDPTWDCEVTNGNSWNCSSDRNLKENFAAADGRAILDRLSRVPILNWNAIGTDPNVKHLGPMAQDFYAAFGLGDDDKRISTIDLDGVALASIQALDQENKDLKAQNASLEARLTKLEQNAPPAAFNGFNLIGLVALAISGLTLLLVQRRLKHGGRT